MIPVYRNKKAFIPLLALSILLIIGGIFLATLSSREPTLTVPETKTADDEPSRIYTDIAYHFSIEYPERVKSIKKNGTGGHFRRNIRRPMDY